MTGRKAIIGLCAICALLVSAVAAQSASAVGGTTVFTCSSKAEVLEFKTEHCVKGESGTAFGHIKVNNGVSTKVTASNAKTDSETKVATTSKLKATVSGAEFQLLATGVHVTGTLENKEEGEEHIVHGKEIVIKYTGVTETLLGCEVEGTPGGVGTIETKKLTATTAGQGDAIKFIPEVGNTFAEFDLYPGAGTCPFAKAAPTFKVIGSIVCVPSGATINCDHNNVTGQKTLRIGGVAGPIAGYDGKVTVTGGTQKESEEGKTTPLSVTTTGETG